MQETQDIDMRHWQEWFSGENNKEVTEKMDTRLAELEARGHTLVSRIRVGRNQPCPCGSGKKFKKCCISKVDEKICQFMDRS